jgi:hypothetical protein
MAKQSKKQPKKRPQTKAKSYYAEGDVDSTAKGSGARANRGKVCLSLVPLHLFAGAARVFMAGKLKYAEWNWAKGMKWSIPMDCLLRHLLKWWYFGEECDQETGEHHLDYAICNLLMLRHYVRGYKEGDDRPPTSLTGFDSAWEDFIKCFDEEDFLNRNPAIRELVEQRKAKS